MSGVTGDVTSRAQTAPVAGRSVAPAAETWDPAAQGRPQTPAPEQGSAYGTANRPPPNPRAPGSQRLLGGLPAVQGGAAGTPLQTIEQFLSERTGHMTAEERTALRHLMRSQAAGVPEAERRALTRAERRAASVDGKPVRSRFAYQLPTLERMYDGSKVALVDTALEARTWLSREAVDRGISGMVERGLRHESVRGDISKLPRLFSESMSIRHRREIAEALSSALSCPDGFKQRLKGAGIQLGTGVVSWKVADKIVHDILGIENPVAGFGAMIFLMHEQGIALNAAAQAAQGSAEISALWSSARAGGGLRAYGRAAAGTMRGMVPIVREGIARAVAGEGLGAAARAEIGAAAGGVERTALRMGASKQAAARAGAGAGAGLNLGTCVLRTQINALKGLGGGLLAAKITGLFMETAGASPEATMGLSTAAFFATAPAKQVLGPTALGRWAGSRGLGRAARFGGNVAVAGLGLDLAMMGSTGLMLGSSDSNLHWAVSAQNSEMLASEMWQGMTEGDMPWYAYPLAGLSIGLYHVSNFISPAWTGSMMDIASGMMGVSHYSTVHGQWRERAEYDYKKVLPFDLLELMINGIDEEFMEPEFYERVDTWYLRREASPSGNRKYAAIAEVRRAMESSVEFARLEPMEQEQAYISAVLAVLSEEQFNEALSFDIAARIRESIEIFHLVDHRDQHGPLREIVNKDGTVRDESAFLGTFMNELIEDLIKHDEAFAGREWNCDSAVLELRRKGLIYRVLNSSLPVDATTPREEVLRMARVEGLLEENGPDPFMDGSHYEIERMDERMDYLPCPLTDRDISDSEVERLRGALMAGGVGRQGRLRELAAGSGLLDESGELEPTPLYFSALKDWIEDAEGLQDPNRLALVRSHVRRLKLAALDAEGPEARQRYQEELDRIDRIYTEIQERLIAAVFEAEGQDPRADALIAMMQ